MNDYTVPLGFLTGLLLTVSAGLILTGHTPRQDDLGLLVTYAAGLLSALAGVAVWRVR